MTLLTSQLLPGFGLPDDLLAPSLMPPHRAAAFVLPTTLIAIFLGPLDVPVGISTSIHAAVMLLALRVVWTVVRICLLMPSLLVSHTVEPQSAFDRRVAELSAGESCAVQHRNLRYTVTRLQLGRGVDTLAISHPLRSDKWVRCQSLN